jgi:hypothetical protein
MVDLSAIRLRETLRRDMKKPREFKKGKCAICSERAELQRPINSFHAWCCLPCLERMKERSAARGRASNLFGNIFQEGTK